MLENKKNVIHKHEILQKHPSSDCPQTHHYFITYELIAARSFQLIQRQT